MRTMSTDHIIYHICSGASFIFVMLPNAPPCLCAPAPEASGRTDWEVQRSPQAVPCPHAKVVGWRYHRHGVARSICIVPGSCKEKWSMFLTSLCETPCSLLAKPCLLYRSIKIIQINPIIIKRLISAHSSKQQLHTWNSFTNQFLTNIEPVAYLLDPVQWMNFSWNFWRMMDDFFLDLMTYTCPITGKKRCAVSAGLDMPVAVKKPSPAEEETCLKQRACFGNPSRNHCSYILNKIFWSYYIYFW